MKRARTIIRLVESELKFWKNVYASDEAHWLDKTPSNLTKKLIKKYAPLGSVLEIGCAAGIDTFYLSGYADSIIGIDIVPQVIEIAKKNLSGQKKVVQKKIKFEIGDAESLRFDNESFDLVYSLSVLHSTDIKKSLPEIKRVLKDDGKAVLYVYTGKNKEEIDKDYFLNVCDDYFLILDQSEFEIKKDSGDDTHTALIVWLKKAKERL
jgi:ubiquinone/menaquinone biosynthesis C-methylase UbiE